MRRKPGRRSGRLRTCCAILAVEPLEARDAPSATQYVLSGTAFATAGTATSFTVRAADNLGVTDPAYIGTVHFASSDPFASLPADYTFTAADAGQHQFSAIFETAGTQSISAQDDANPSIQGSQNGIVVAPGPTAGFLIDAGEVASQGVPMTVTVTAVDAFDNATPGYVGTVHFTSTDPLAVLPRNYRFTRADNGQHAFPGVTFQTAGSQSVTATDVFSPSLTGEGFVYVFESRSSGVQLSVSRPEIQVGGTVVLNGTLTFANDFPVTVSIDWEDGSPPTSLLLQPGAVNFTASHTYLIPSDDTPTGAFTIVATVGGDDDQPLTGTANLIVDNVPLDVATDTFFVVADVGEPVTLTGTYTNPTNQPLVATVDFDDGSDPQPLALAPDGTFSVTHAFTGEDVYDVTVSIDNGVNTVSDDTLVLVFYPELNDGTSQAVPPGGQATVSAPGITARVDHASTDPHPAVLTVGRYDTIPVSDFGNLILAAYELRLAGAGPDDRLTVTFSVPTGFGDDVRLEFYDPQTHTFRPVQFSPGSFTFDPAAHTITVVFDQTSFPRVTDLHGTIFTISVAVPEAVPSVVGVSFASTTAAAPSSFSSAGQRTLTLSPTTDGGPSVAQALLSGEGGGSDADQAADQVAAAPDPRAGQDDTPLAGRGPVVGTDDGDQHGDDAAGPFLLWPLSPAADVPVWPLSEPMPKEPNKPQGALSRPRKDDYWIEPTPEKVSPSAGAVLAVLALAPGLMLNKSPRRRPISLTGENPSSDCPI